MIRPSLTTTSMRSAGTNTLDSSASTAALAISPESFPDADDRVEVIETHFAWVFLVGQRAYKMKKPVLQPLFDLRSIEARRADCEEEVRVNSRLAPDVYLGVMPLAAGADGKLRLGGEGTPVDWLVCMKRLPSHLMLERAIATRSTSSEALRAVGIVLAEFYRRQASFIYSPETYIGMLRRRIREDTDALLVPELNLPNAHVHAAAAAIDRALAHVGADLGQRAGAGRIVDAHGDLRPEHICLCDPPRIIDALEFSPELRRLDTAEELAFLVLECEVAGEEAAGVRIVEAYCAESQDSFHDRVLDFYRSRRALMRAKITAWHLCDPAVRDLAPWSERACAYVDLAKHYARRVLGEHDDSLDRSPPAGIT